MVQDLLLVYHRLLIYVSIYQYLGIYLPTYRWTYLYIYQTSCGVICLSFRLINHLPTQALFCSTTVAYTRPHERDNLFSFQT